MASVSFTSRIGLRLSGIKSVTRPAPALAAPRHTSAAARFSRGSPIERKRVRLVLCASWDDAQRTSRTRLRSSGLTRENRGATLVCLGAARAGAGLVTLFIPESLNPILEVKLTEAMTLPIAETAEKTPSSDAFHEMLHFLKGKQALAMGPGIRPTLIRRLWSKNCSRRRCPLCSTPRNYCGV